MNQATYSYWQTRFSMSSNTPAIPWSAYVWFEPWGFSTTNETYDGYGTTTRVVNVYGFDPNNSLYISQAGTTNFFDGAPSNVWFELPGSIAGVSVTNGTLGNHYFYSDATLGPNPYDIANVCPSPSRTVETDGTGGVTRLTFYDQHLGWDIRWTKDGSQNTSFRHSYGNRVIVIMDFRQTYQYKIYSEDDPIFGPN